MLVRQFVEIGLELKSECHFLIQVLGDCHVLLLELQPVLPLVVSFFFEAVLVTLHRLHILSEL